mmetsp:Transcript_33252/g.80385  ORF Transcript_33252/g.80385 Transcript_33252/m.80385 type:complete len:268 (-) Transcript_33252:3029-3832(-)
MTTRRRMRSSSKDRVERRIANDDAEMTTMMMMIIADIEKRVTGKSTRKRVGDPPNEDLDREVHRIIIVVLTVMVVAEEVVMIESIAGIARMIDAVTTMTMIGMEMTIVAEMIVVAAEVGIEIIGHETTMAVMTIVATIRIIDPHIVVGMTAIIIIRIILLIADTAEASDRIEGETTIVVMIDMEEIGEDPTKVVTIIVMTMIVVATIIAMSKMIESMLPIDDHLITLPNHHQQQEQVETIKKGIPAKDLNHTTPRTGDTVPKSSGYY